MGIFKRQGRPSKVLPVSEFYLSGATLSNGISLNFQSGDIVLLVGPNNSGKSTFLNDIKSYLKSSHDPRKMLKELKFSFSSSDVIRNLVGKRYKLNQDRTAWYALDDEGKRDFHIDFDRTKADDFYLRRAADALAISLNAETRLALSNPVPTIDISYGSPRHPYHHFMLDRKKLAEFASVIKDAFSLDFTITRIGNPIRGYVGAAFDNANDSLEADKLIPAKGEQMERQGDGIRSYSGIAAEIYGNPYPITLLDEPEAFLHPPQAKMLGNLFATSLPPDCQGFIATHSSDFLQGILYSKSKRVRILRLDRGGGTVNLQDLNNAQLNSAVSHPSIANSNLLDSLFFSQTVICEGDADCSLLDWLVRELGGEALKGVDRFWFATGGKHQTPKIAALLAAFGVDFRVVLDLDALGDWELLSKLCELKGIDIGGHRKRISAALSVLQKPSPGAIAAELQEKLRSLPALDEETERNLIREIQKVLDRSRRSHPLKQYGVAAFRNGQERSDVETFLSLLGEKGITLLPKGEIESYVPQVGLHGPGWAAAVLESYDVHEEGLKHLLGDISQGIS